MSLPRLIYGSNRVGIGNSLVHVAITRLKEVLDIDPSHCRLSRIEIGATFPVKHPPYQYLSKWVRLPGMARDTMNYGQTVYFQNKVWSVYGYDKDAEQRVETDAGCYNLRIEYKRNSKLSRLFNGEPLTVGALAWPEVFRRLVMIWADKYFKIEKSTSGMELSIPRTPTMLMEELATYGLRSYGEENVLALIASAARTKCIDRKTATRMRSSVAYLCEPSPRDPQSVSSEIDQLVLERTRDAGGDVEKLIAAYGIGSPGGRYGS